MDLLLTIVVIFLTVKWGDWKNWQRYYPTILFWALGNFVHLHLTQAKPLWLFSTPILPRQLADIMQSLVIFPCVILLFLPHLPKQGIGKKALYISFWVVTFSVIEFWAVKIGHFRYANNWRFLYSVLFNVFMFPLLVIHQKSPLLAWLMSIASAFSVMYVLEIPFLAY